LNKLTYLSILFIIILFGCKKADPIAPTPKPLIIDKYLYEGDSMTDTVQGYRFNWPAQIVKLSKSASLTPQVNVATTAETVQMMGVEYITQVHPHAPNPNQNYIFFLLAGTNDAYFGHSPAQIYSDLKTEWKQARGDGFKVVAFCLPRSTMLMRDTTNVKVNKLIIADLSQFDYLIRTDTLLPDPTDLTLWQTDGIHPNAAGSIKIAKEVLKVIGLKN
jgi:lysophospholipase L1-like esterase